MTKLNARIGIAVMLLLAVLSAISTASAASNVCRDLPASSQNADSEISVSLEVTLDGALWYTIDEIIPAGLTVTDDGGANTNEPGHLKWIVMSNTVDTVYTYKVKGSAGTYNFDGEFEMQGMSNPDQINCDTQLTIEGEVPPSGEGSVCRNLPAGSQNADSEISVSIDVTVDGASWYTIDEEIPAGLTVTDDGGANTNEPGHLKWIVVENAADTTYTYKVKGSAGTYNFDGEFEMQGMSNPDQINCDTQLSIEGEAPPSGEAGVCRNLPASSQNPDAEVAVSLDVTVDGANWYLIDEIIPPGLTVTDADGANTSHAGHLKWVVIADAVDTTYTYKVKGPLGTYDFDGEFKMQGMSAIDSIGCDSELVIEETQPFEEGIVLKNGWNFISVPCVLENDSVGDVMEGVDYEAIVLYDANGKVWKVPTSIKPLTGYAIKVNNSTAQVITNLMCSGNLDVPASMQLYKGWNAVGLTGFVPKTAEFTFYVGDIDDSYSKVWGPWDPVMMKYKYHGYNQNVFGDIPGGEVSPDIYTENYTLKPFEGHWVYLTEDAVLSAIA